MNEKNQNSQEQKTEELFFLPAANEKLAEKEATPAKQKALDTGWVEKADWEESGKDPDEWVDYRTYNKNGEMMGRITQQTKQIRDMDKKLAEAVKVIDDLKDYNKKISEVEYKRAMATMKKQKAKAMEDQDFDAVTEIDETMDELKDARKEEQARWFQDPANSWYFDNVAMRGAADAIANDYMSEHPHDYAGTLRAVEEGIRAEFPDRFKKRANRVSKSDEGPPSSSNAKKYTPKDLNEEQRAVARRFVSQGVFKNQQAYVDNLVANDLLD
jgi:hypothetical protein